VGEGIFSREISVRRKKKEGGVKIKKSLGHHLQMCCVGKRAHTFSRFIKEVGRKER